MTSFSNSNDHHRISPSAAGLTVGWTRALSQNSGLGGPAIGGAGDAFAEVFRMMANASPPTARQASSSDSEPQAAEAETEQTTEASAGPHQNDPGEENAPVQPEEVLNIEPPPAHVAASEQPAAPVEPSEQDVSLPAALADSTPREPTAQPTAPAAAPAAATTTAVQAVSGTPADAIAAEAATEAATAVDATVAATVASKEDVTRRQASRTSSEVVPVTSENTAADKSTLSTEAKVSSADQAAETSVRYAGDAEPASARSEHLRDRRREGGSQRDRTAAATDQPTPQSARPLESDQRSQQPLNPASAVRAGDPTVATGVDSGSPSVASPALPTPSNVQPSATPAAVATSSIPSIQTAESGAATRGGETLTPANPNSSPDPGVTTGSDKKPSSMEGPRVADRAILVQRVSKAFQRLGLDGGQVRIRLHPEELGSVQLQMSIQGQRMSGRVVAETEAARSILAEHLPELRQRLAEQGIQVERLEVSLEGEPDPRGQQNQSGTQQGGAGQGSGHQQGHPRWTRSQPTATDPQASPNENATANSGSAGRSVIEAARHKKVDLVG